MLAALTTAAQHDKSRNSSREKSRASSQANFSGPPELAVEITLQPRCDHISQETLGLQ
jgi:hypothetical protein